MRAREGDRQRARASDIGPSQNQAIMLPTAANHFDRAGLRCLPLMLDRLDQKSAISQ